MRKALLAIAFSLSLLLAAIPAQAAQRCNSRDCMASQTGETKPNVNDRRGSLIADLPELPPVVVDVINFLGRIFR